MLQRPCLDCSVGTARPGLSRCFTCETTKEHRRRAHRRAAPSTNAQQRMRRAINEQGAARCAACREWFAAQAIEVDHRLALADGGTDTDGNVQPLCRGCHGAKSAEERRRRH